MTASMAEDSVPGSNGITFLSFLQGAAGARINANAKGAFLGITLGTKKADMARSVIEGICFEMYDIIRAEEAAGIEVNTIRLTAAPRSPRSGARCWPTSPARRSSP